MKENIRTWGIVTNLIGMLLLYVCRFYFGYHDLPTTITEILCIMGAVIVWAVGAGIWLASFFVINNIKPELFDFENNNLPTNERD